MDREAYLVPGIILGIGIPAALLVGRGVYLLEQRVKEEAMKGFKAGQTVIAEVLAENHKDSKYILKCRREDTFGYGIEDGIFALSVIDGDSVTKESLDELIEVGSKISFPEGRLSEPDTIYPEETHFTKETQAGTKRADRIKVLGSR